MSSTTSIFETMKRGGPGAVFQRLRNGAIARFHYFFDARFDRRHGIETSQGRDLEDLDIDSPNKALGVEYAPTPVTLLPLMLRAMKVDPARETFVDLGCGKGRVMVKAAEFGFRKLVGVEFAPELAETARDNLKAALRDKSDIDWDVRQEDVVGFQPPESDLCVFAYNPFNGSVFEAALDILAAHAARGWNVNFIYYNPQSQSLVEAHPAFEPVSKSASLNAALALASWHGAALYRVRAGEAEAS